SANTAARSCVGAVEYWMAGWSIGRGTYSSSWAQREPASATATAALAARRGLCMPHLDLPQRAFGGRVLEQIGNRTLPQDALNVVQRLIHAAMQRAQVGAMSPELERAGADTLERIHRVDYVENRQSLGGRGKREAAILAPLGLN